MKLFHQIVISTFVILLSVVMLLGCLLMVQTMRREQLFFLTSKNAAFMGVPIGAVNIRKHPADGAWRFKFNGHEQGCQTIGSYVTTWHNAEGCPKCIKENEQ